VTAMESMLATVRAECAAVLGECTAEIVRDAALGTDAVAVHAPRMDLTVYADGSVLTSGCVYVDLQSALAARPVTGAEADARTLATCLAGWLAWDPSQPDDSPANDAVPVGIAPLLRRYAPKGAEE